MHSISRTIMFVKDFKKMTPKVEAGILSCFLCCGFKFIFVLVVNEYTMTPDPDSTVFYPPSSPPGNQNVLWLLSLKKKTNFPE